MLLLSDTLSTEIKKLIAYFAVFDYPLTAWEIWQYLPITCDWQTVRQTLSAMTDNSPLERGGRRPGCVSASHGFYFLPDRANTVETRQERYGIADQKIKRLKPIAKLFSLLPWIKLICLANQIGNHNLRAAGDIDLLIVVEPRRLWITRLFCNGLLQLLRLRPTVRQTQNTICLSFWLTTDHLNMTPYLLRQAPDLPDRYFLYWLCCLSPLYDQNETYQKLLAQNTWLKTYLPNWSGRNREVKYHYLQTRHPAGYENLMRYLGDKLEAAAKNLQQKIMAPAIKERMNRDTCVVVNDTALKLHTNDRRQYFFEQYLKNLENHN